MAKPMPMELRERVVAAVEKEGLSRHKAAERFAVSVSAVVAWLARYHKTGSVAPGQMGGHKPRALSAAHGDWLRRRLREGDFTIRGLVAELAEERGLKVDYRSVWQFVHDEGLSFKKKRGGWRA
jgi:transposase